MSGQSSSISLSSRFGAVPGGLDIIGRMTPLTTEAIASRIHMSAKLLPGTTDRTVTTSLDTPPSGFGAIDVTKPYKLK